MAQFCWDCLAEEIFPEAPERNDFAGLCAEGEMVSVLCEGHGVIWVDHQGRRVQHPGESSPSEGR